jgi:hypothetical protein
VNINKRALVAGAAILAATAFASQASAQSQRAALASAGSDSNFARDRNVSVRQRPHPDFDARGLPLGAFNAFPKLSLTAEFNDNIYAQDTNETDDLIWRLQPEVTVISDWNRHGLTAYARASVNRFQDNQDEDTEEYTLGASGRIDVLRFTNITGGVEYSQLTEPRTTTATLTGDFDGPLEPVQFDQMNAFVAAAHEFNRLKLSGRLDYRTFDYEDSVRRTGLAPLDQDYRDRDVLVLTGRADYAVSPATAVFVEVSGNQREYDSVAATPGFVQRDSEGVQLLAGANFELGALARGEIALGYMEQEYDAASIGSIDGFGARAQVEWFPTELTTVTFAGARTVEDAAVPNSPGYLASSLSAAIDHELLRNVIVSAQAGFGSDDYEGIEREDERVTAGLSATYLLNRNVGLTGAYSYLDLKSEGATAGPEYTVNKVSATLTLQF